MTTKYSAGRYWIIDSVTLSKVPFTPSFATFGEAREAIGSRWVDADLEG
jgi:hypothetical protein